MDAAMHVTASLGDVINSTVPNQQPADVRCTSLNTGENAVLRQLWKAWTCVIKLTVEWSNVLQNHKHLDSIANQLEQRRCVQECTLFRAGLPLFKLPNVRARLLAKIDNHMTGLCRELDVDLTKLQAMFDKAQESYIKATAIWEKYRAQFLEDEAKLTQRTATRPSINELFSWMDEIILCWRNELNLKQKLYGQFVPSKTKEFDALRKSWKIPFKWEQRLTADILPLVRIFLEFHKDL